MSVIWGVARSSGSVYFLLTFSFCLGTLSLSRAADVDAEDLRPGLVAIYRDAARPKPVEITRIEPALGFTLKAGESFHPRLAPDGETVRWEGYLNVLRAGTYRFRAVLRGRFRLTVAGKELLAAEGKDAAPITQDGPETKLESGVHPLSAEFTRLPGDARLELWWQSPYFRREPLPYDVLGHLPKQEPAALAKDTQMERGRFLAEERNCTACHRPEDADRLAKGLATRQGPDLSQVGQRVHAGWLDRWLETPQKVRPGSVMPQLFGEDEAGRVERQAVVRYLVSLGGPVSAAPPINTKDWVQSVARGQALFNSVGCVVCHRPDKEKPKESGALPVAVRYPIDGLGSKMTPQKLSAYLQNPLAIDPSGRMPHMLLQGKEAEDMARYLCEMKDASIPVEAPAAPSKEQVLAALQRLESKAEDVAAFQKLPADAQLRDLGKRLVVEKGCNNCHTIAPGGKPLAAVAAQATFNDLKNRQKHEGGCLAAEGAKRGKAPVFAFGTDDRKAVRAFLEEGASGAGSPAPLFAARVTLHRFNCLACHNRNGKGGLSPELVEELRRYEKAENAEAVSPPTLTGVGHRLRTPWLRQVLTQAGRARPWMGLRMPQFGEAHVGPLPETLAALEGATPEDTPHAVPLTAAKLEAGRHLNGKNAFGCIGCHDIAGVANKGTRGPDLATMTQRVRFEWYRRWLEQPLRMQPGTRMPSVFTEGKSLIPAVLGGSADAQAEAMWAYYSLGPGLPLPDGLEPPKGLVLTLKDRPILLRTFMPDAGSRAVAVGFPGGVATAFDAVTCRLAYAWSGNFLDASPVWNDRGGNPAKVLGPQFWKAPPGCPWGVTASNEPPDFLARAKDPAFGGALPEGKVHDGARQVRFEGYSTDKEGLPTFRYRLNAADPQSVAVTEQPLPLHSPVAAGLARRFTLEVPAQQTPWLFAGETTREPRLLDSKGMALPLDLKTGSAEVPAAGNLLVLPQDSEHVIVLALSSAPAGSRWQLYRLGNTWQALLHLPTVNAAGKVEVLLNVWAPYRDEPGLLKDLVEAK
jgi:mono/diheme cytochrome c family protein